MVALNNNLQRLFLMAQKPVKIGIGLMSGTSLDGLDIALCRLTGSGFNTQVELLQFETLPYTEDFRNEVKEVFSRRTVDLEKLCVLNAFIGNLHGSMINQQLKRWDVPASHIDFIASHGQTIYHAPQRLHQLPGYPNATLQIGDGDHIARETGIFTISDFRQKNLAAGGEGAPLALYGDVILGSKTGENRVLLNIGGIANFTFLPADGDSSKIRCSDIGPGNTLIDAASKRYFDKPYDKDSLIGLSGNINGMLLGALQDDDFFNNALPKTTGPELFNLAYLDEAQRKSGTQYMAPNDIIATLSAFTAKTIAHDIKQNYSHLKLKMYVSGGGARNPMVMQYLQKFLRDVAIADTKEIGIEPDAKEAILFALLGNEATCGEPIKIGNNPQTLMGKFSFPL